VTKALREALVQIYRRPGPPEPDALRAKLERVLDCLCCEPASARPRDLAGRPGGIIELDRDLPTILVSDLHGRREYFLRVLVWKAEPGARTLDLLEAGRIQVVCLGDGLHSEGRTARRWLAAMEEYAGGYERHEQMDAEMREGLGVMEMVMEVKLAFPTHFHFLKGNHENITNELGAGNFPFGKYAREGEMTLEYMRRFYGDEVLARWARFEKELPLLAIGRGFLASHAEPRTFFPRDRVIGFRDDPEVVAGLTWTDNGEAEPDAVRRMLDHYLGEDAAQARFFGGHRWTPEGYRLRADDRYVQFNDPERFMIAHLDASGDIDPARDLLDVRGRARG
jgi:hypothetical protein